MQESRNEPHSVFDQYKEKYFDAAAEGDLARVTACLKVIPEIDLKNEKGWTSLMFAARNGHSNVAKLLLEKGCDPYVINNNGFTSLDIAQFWNRKGVMELLMPSTEPAVNITGILPSLPSLPKPNFFSKSLLDRAADRRKDQEWLDIKMKDMKSKFLLFSDLQPVVVPIPDESLGKTLERLRLLTVSCDEISDLLKEEHISIFLGLEPPKYVSEANPSAMGELKDVGRAWFALGFASLSEDRLYKLHPHSQIMTPFPGIMQLLEKEAGILAQARAVLAWHDRYVFCPTCGGATRVQEAGYKRVCVQDDCRSNQGVHNTCYPRVDPTVIMAVISPDKSQLLLGRGKRFPRQMWSCLAGFMEPGETIEDACRREVEEESNIKVGHVEYHSCQPWPMPASLMIGCLGYATSTEITVDKEELEEARWFNRQDVVQMLTQQHPKGFFTPPGQAIAHQLIRAWVARTSNL